MSRLGAKQSKHVNSDSNVKLKKEEDCAQPSTSRDISTWTHGPYRSRAFSPGSLPVPNPAGSLHLDLARRPILYTPSDYKFPFYAVMLQSNNL